MSRKEIANIEFEVMGGTPKVFRYWDEKEEKNIDVLSCVDSPFSEVTSYATIGLSEYSIGLMYNNKDLRIELVGASYTKDELFPNLFSTVSFEIMDSGKCEYGTVIPDVITQYISDCEMKHIYLMNPFLWEGFNSLQIEDTYVTWLLVVPISDNEKKFLIEKGWEALETKFEESDIDIFNIYRTSVM